MMMLPLLAEAAANADTMNYLTTGAITAICSAITGVVLYAKGAKDKGDRQVTLKGQPLEIALQERYVTRQELSEFKGEIKADIREMRGSYDRLVLLLDERERKLTELIEKVASGAFEGRRRIHEEVNAQGKQIAAIGVNSDVSKHIGKLGSAIMTHLKNCPIAAKAQS